MGHVGRKMHLRVSFPQQCAPPPCLVLQVADQMTRAARLVIDMRNCVIHADWHGARSAAQALESLPSTGWAVATSALLADELGVVTSECNNQAVLDAVKEVGVGGWGFGEWCSLCVYIVFSGHD